MAPYFCHIHNGLYIESDDGAEGCHHEKCVEFREMPGPPPRIIFGAVPGGTTKASMAKQNSVKFHEDMYAFEDAAKQGLKPRKVSKKAAFEAEVLANAGSQDTSTGAGIQKFNEEVKSAIGEMGDYD